MRRRKRIKPLLLIACFVLGISGLLINSHDFVPKIFNSGLDQEKKQFDYSFKSGKEDLEDTACNTEEDFDDPYEINTSALGASLVEQSEVEQYTVSRGIRDQSVPINPTEIKSAIPTEVKEAVPTEDKPSAAADSTTMSTKELDLLSRLITAEAQAEPYEAKVAVGAVVLNRVESSSWPNTIKDVIYQNINGYYQFTPVVNGWIDKPAESGSIKAANAALSGVDPTTGAEFYYDDTTTNEWILAKPVSVKIGHMIFAF